MSALSQAALVLALVLASSRLGESAALAGAPESPGAKAAQTSDHWSFKVPQDTPIPQAQGQHWVRNPIDAFVVARLQGTQPSPEADRPTLIRRLSFDLIGLPPTPEEVESFIKDRSADAYERLVDRLLASPHFGERWGRHWLDLARYADSDGYEKDTGRPYAYLFRDWVIQAINRDMPFDQFTIEQLAGDLLPDATLEQKSATGFHRQTLTNKEGGVDQEEFRCKAVVDRISTIGAVWLGLTVGCAECHNHKYDPIAQNEFYQLFAFFNNAAETDLPAPQPVELAKFTSEKAAWDTENTARKEALAAYLTTELPARQAQWERDTRLPATRWMILEPNCASSEGDATLTIQADGSVSAGGERPDTDTYTVEVETRDLAGVTGFRLEVLVDPKTRSTTRGKDGGFELSEVSIDLIDSRDDITSTPVALVLAAGSEEGSLPPAALDGDLKTGWTGTTNRLQVIVFETQQELSLRECSRLIFTLNQQGGKGRTIARFRVSATTSARPLEPSVIPDQVVMVLAASPDKRTPKEIDDVRGYFAREADPLGRRINEELAEHGRREPGYPATKAAVLIEEHEKRRKSHVHIRGDFLRPGPEVQPGTPAILHPLKPRAEVPDRLDLAKWLLDDANPLTARVTVNHIWKNLFGRPLVGTVADFGTRGDKPTHPELLDWLAREFRRKGWSRKSIIRLITSSATYRQDSRHRSELDGRDPTNAWLARQNRFRLDAENVRDACLAVSGLLNPSIGGTSIRPQLPADIAALGYANSVKWQESEGSERYRRGLYIFFQRTVPYPMLMAFDAPDSNATCTRRERSNTPLQALALLNDPVFFECAQALGKRIDQGTGSPRDRMDLAFRICLSRDPESEERRRLVEFYDQHLRELRSNPESAARIIGGEVAVGGGGEERDSLSLEERATLVAVARVMMNLDEFVTRP